jgi:hypothetical protein
MRAVKEDYDENGKQLAKAVRFGCSFEASVPRNLTGNGEETTLANYRFGISMDGCHVLASTYVRQPQASDDRRKAVMQALVLRLDGNSASCEED